MHLLNIILRTFMFIIKLVQPRLTFIVAKLLKGKLDAKQLRLAIAWIEIHREELLADWTLCQNGEKPFPIEPLK